MHDDIYWMTHALKLAKQAQNNGEVPVGAVIIKNNKIISQGQNSSIIKHDPTAHAEIIALRNAGTYLQNYRLLNTTMYVTLEPCMMCTGAIIISRIERLVFSIYNTNTHHSIPLANLLNTYKIKIHTGVLVKECTNIIQNFFFNKRIK
ncbi:tRNA adenosine(34) deaminase TadA [Enterobacteriaceae endosymbiont of Macroplea mutica]|uniref:tRNA adenosine(34) deaminase TadA n=1 Tax=Enterobacteriaceae endosymbiont of Macroplea mutica TaxID=2675791 RepID=UPI001448C28E|nr:tRNA adenosine(34) deaminase TadA [Enterobacteriaceae endosymbiont of Macroplea mutica]QJC31085.1 tRNA adenosine(34) deaminase TadA [Enterobacteriaceae endosymbiont of Macroplea mutica]